MKGAIDMHIHIGPESRLKRRQDALELARTARDMGMKAIVMKNREYGTGGAGAARAGTGTGNTGLCSYTMDNEAAALIPAAALAWVTMGAKVVWMPTVRQPFHGQTLRSRGLQLPGIPQTILDENGKLLPVVREIFQVIKEKNVVLGTGHLTPREVFVLVEEARAFGIEKVVLTHVLQDQLVDELLTNEEISSW